MYLIITCTDRQRRDTVFIQLLYDLFTIYCSNLNSSELNSFPSPFDLSVPPNRTTNPPTLAAMSTQVDKLFDLI